MDLTRRRRDFLRKVVRLSGPSNEPVHYKLVAKAVGVSRWTAYDVLRELERLGLLETRYIRAEEQGHGPGRARVYYVPTEMALQVCAGEADDVNLDLLEEWHQAKERLLRLIDRADRVGPRYSVDQLLREMPRVRKGLIKSAYLSALLVIQCRALGQQSAKLAHSLLARAPRAELALGVFAGAVGGLLGRAAVAAARGRQVQAWVGRMQQAAAHLSRDEARLLADFVGEALGRPS